MDIQSDTFFESKEKESMLILEKSAVKITPEISQMLACASDQIQLALSLKQLSDLGFLKKVEHLKNYQQWFEIDGTLFAELVQLGKHHILATLEIELVGDTTRDYAMFRAINAIIKSGLEAEINKYHQALNHPQFDYVNFANTVEALSRR